MTRSLFNKVREQYNKYTLIRHNSRIKNGHHFCSEHKEKTACIMKSCARETPSTCFTILPGFLCFFQSMTPHIPGHGINLNYWEFKHCTIIFYLPSEKTKITLYIPLILHLSGYIMISIIKAFNTLRQI